MQSLTSGNPTRLIIAFALPMLIGTVFQQIYSFTDAAAVGHFLGVNSLAAVGATGSLTFLLVGFSWGASAGLAIPISRAFGAGDMDGVRRYTAAGGYVAAAIALVITVIGVTFTPNLLALLNTPTEIMPESVTFLQILFLGAPITVTFNYLIAVIRALGDSKTPLYFLIASSLLNAGLVVLFLGPLGTGIGGAAATTVMAQASVLIACFWLIVKKMPALRLTKQDWADGRYLLSDPMRMGLPMGFQMSIIAIGAVILQTGVNGLGANSVAAFTAVSRVDQIAVAPLNALGMAMATYVAQNRGAQQWRRIRQGVARATAMAAVASVVLGALLYAFAPVIVNFFVESGTPGANMNDMARTFFLINGGLYIVLGVMFILRNTVQGMGNAKVPTIAGFAEMALRSLAGLFLVSSLGWVGVSMAAPLAWIGALIPVTVAWFGHRKELLRNERFAELEQGEFNVEVSMVDACAQSAESHPYSATFPVVAPQEAEPVPSMA